MAQRGQSIRSMLWIKIDANCDRDHGAMIAIEALPQGLAKRIHPAPFPESRAKPVCPGARNRSMRCWIARMTGPSGEAFHGQQSKRRSRPTSASTTPLSRKRNPKSRLIDLARKCGDHDREARTRKAGGYAPLCDWPCSCHPNHAIGRVQDCMNEIIRAGSGPTASSWQRRARWSIGSGRYAPAAGDPMRSRNSPS